MNLFVILMYLIGACLSVLLLYFINSKKIKMPLIVIGWLAVFILFFTPITGLKKVNETEVGLVRQGGKVVQTASSGFNFIIPFAQDLIKISTQIETSKFDMITSYTKDQQTIDSFVSLTFLVSPSNASKVYQEFGSIENYLSRIARRVLTSTLGEVVGQYSAEDLTVKRKAFAKEYERVVKEKLSQYPIDIISVQIENLVFSAEYTKQISNKVNAEVEVLTRENNKRTAEVDKEITIIKAQAESEAILVRAKAEADALNLKGDALKSNPELIKLMEVEKWNGIMPTTLLSKEPSIILNK